MDKSEPNNRTQGQDQAEPLPDLAKLSLAEMEALIARKRLEESRKVLRKVRARAPQTPPPDNAEPSASAASESRLASRPVSSRPKPVTADPSPSRFRPSPKVVAPEQRFHQPGLEVNRRGRRSVRGDGSQRFRNWIGYLLEGLVVLAVLVVCGNWILLQFGISLNLFDLNRSNNLQPLSLSRSEGPLLNVSASGVIAVPATPTAPATVIPGPTTSVGATPGPIVAAPPTTAPPTAIPGAAAILAPTPTAVIVQSKPANLNGPVSQDDAANVSPRRVVIPRIGVDSVIKGVTVDLGNWQVADFAVGHHLGTANPGQAGNMVLAGHRDIRGSVFLRLNELRMGDEIKVFTDNAVYRYIVTTTSEVEPTDTWVMNPTVEPTATLITCTPIGYATRRLIVRAQLQP